MKPADWGDWPYSRKLAWRCLHPDPRVDYRTWVDKHLVKSVVTPGFDVPETYFTTHDPDLIDAGRLPDTYVMKARHGYDMCLLVRDGIVEGGNRNRAHAGRRADTPLLRAIARAWFASKHEALRRTRERQYLFARPGVLFERHLADIDYELQLFLFEGRCRLAMVMYRGFYHRGGMTHRLYDQRWRRLAPGSREAAACQERAAPETPPPPEALLERLEGLCQRIDHVRADFLVCGERYYFCEFTFTHNAGRAGFIGRYDAELGRYWPA